MLEILGDRQKELLKLLLRKKSGLTVDGEYNPPAETDGRKTALDKLVTLVVEGAQSQW